MNQFHIKLLLYIFETIPEESNFFSLFLLAIRRSGHHTTAVVNL